MIGRMTGSADMKSMVTAIAREKEKQLLLQLGDLVTKGLLVMEEGETVLVQDPCSPDLQLRSTVRLVLKDKDYIAALEQKVEQLEKRLEDVASAVAPVLNRVGGR